MFWILLFHVVKKQEDLPCGRDYYTKNARIAVMEVKIGKYKHSKTGNIYRVLGVAMHSETHENLVVYEPLDENPVSKLWVRPQKIFEEEVDVGGKKVPRFSYIDK